MPHTLTEIMIKVSIITGNDIRDSNCAALGWGTLQGDSLLHTLTEIKSKVSIITGNDIRDSNCAAPYWGTVCHTHSEIRNKVSIITLLTGNDIRDSNCAALGWGTLQGDSLSHTL